ncbi:MAG: aquaporin [Ilumatobacteraceae bacterium]
MESPDAPLPTADPVPPPAPDVAQDGPGDPTVGAGIADTGTVVTSYVPVVTAELIGTAVLVLAGPGSAILAAQAIGILGVALAFGFALLILAYVLGPISGCHINPAITLGMLLANKITVRHAVWAWIAQFVGGIMGACIIFGIASGRDGWQRGGFASNGWDRDGFSGLGATIIVEIVFTALLVFVVLSTTGRRFAPGFGGLVAGITLTLIHLVTIPVDNTGVNPARSLATAIFADTDPSALSQLWAFIIFPLIGSVIGVFVWLLVDEARLESTMLDTEILRATRDRIDEAVDDV